MRKIKKLFRRFCITYWPWPPFLWREHNKKAKKLKGFARILAKRPRARTGKGWNLYRKRFSKVFKAAQIKEDVVDWLTQYPFNRYGWTDFKYWFKYRLQKKHQYHILRSGLKPGYYEYYDVVVNTIAGPRFKELFQRVWKEFEDQKDELDYENKPIIRPEYHKTMDILKEAYLWFTEGKKAMQKEIDDLYNVDTDREKLTAKNMWSYFERKPSKKERDKMKRIRKLEKEIFQKDTKYLKVIIDNRVSLST